MNFEEMREKMNPKMSVAKGIGNKQAEDIIMAEAERYLAEGKFLGEISLEVDGDEIVVRSSPASTIKRVRRITGYLSDENNFNDAKRAELKDRVEHETHRTV